MFKASYLGIFFKQSLKLYHLNCTSLKYFEYDKRNREKILEPIRITARIRLNNNKLKWTLNCTIQDDIKRREH